MVTESHVTSSVGGLRNHTRQTLDIYTQKLSNSWQSLPEWWIHGRNRAQHSWMWWNSMTTLANEPHPPNYFTLALQQCHQGTGQKAMEWQHKHIPIRKTKIYHKYNKQRTSHITFAGPKWMAASCMPTILQCTVATLSPRKCQGMHHPCSVYQQTEGCTQQLAWFVTWSAAHGNQWEGVGCEKLHTPPYNYYQPHLTFLLHLVFATCNTNWWKEDL